MSGQFANAEKLVKRLSLRESDDANTRSADALDQDDETPIVYVGCSHDTATQKTTYTFDMSDVFSEQDQENNKNWWCRVRGYPSTMEYAELTIDEHRGTCVISGVSKPVLSRGLSVALFKLDNVRNGYSAASTTPLKKMWTSEKTLSTRPLVENRLGLLPVEYVDDCTQQGCLWTMYFGDGDKRFYPVLRWNKTAPKSLLESDVMLGTLLPGLVYSVARKLLDLKAEEDLEDPEDTDSMDDSEDCGRKKEQWANLLWEYGLVPKTTNPIDADREARSAVNRWSTNNDKWFKKLYKGSSSVSEDFDEYS